MRYRSHETPLGQYLIVVDEDDALVGLYRAGQSHFPSDEALGTPDQTVAEEIVNQLDEYLAGERHEFDLATAPAGTDFQRQVWAAMRQIPYGRTVSYGELAAEIGRPRAARAVGAAIGRNPISIVVPCHRVVGASGELIGYAGGADAKRWLLDLERSAENS